MAAGITRDDVAWAQQKIAQLRSGEGALDHILGHSDASRVMVECVEFLRLKVGPKSALHWQASRAVTKAYATAYAMELVGAAMEAFVAMHRDGQLSIPVEAQARVAAATDLMEQVEALLDDRRVHPAAPVMLAGAALEEMLRSMVVANSSTVKGKPGINSYASALRTDDVISAQEAKDISSWGGLRNHAAHGEFEQIQLPNARLLAQAVNLFMQKHAP